MTEAASLLPLGLLLGTNPESAAGASRAEIVTRDLVPYANPRLIDGAATKPIGVSAESHRQLAANGSEPA